MFLYFLIRVIIDCIEIRIEWFLLFVFGLKCYLFYKSLYIWKGLVGIVFYGVFIFVFFLFKDLC